MLKKTLFTLVCSFLLVFAGCDQGKDLQIYYIHGNAMEPSFSDGDYVTIDKSDKEFERGDIVLYENSKGYIIIGRIVGLPSESVDIRDGYVMINGEKLDEGEYVSGIGKTKGYNYASWINREKTYYYILPDNREGLVRLDEYTPAKYQAILGSVKY